MSSMDKSYICWKLSSYKYKFYKKAKQDLFEVIQKYSGLQPLESRYNFGDGKHQNLLTLEGVILIKFKGKEYFIPLQIWIMRKYPFDAPIVFVKPTPNMQLMVSRNLGEDGKVFLPYLQEWNINSPQSNLLRLIQILVVQFGESPPVYRKAEMDEEMLLFSSICCPISVPEAEAVFQKESIKLRLRIDVELNQLPKTTCKICYSEEVDALAIPCGYVFCKVCLERVNIEIEARCPQCRTKTFKIQTVLFP